VLISDGHDGAAVTRFRDAYQAVVAGVGADVAGELFVRMGPRTAEVPEPLSIRVLNFVQKHVVLRAFNPDCQCWSEAEGPEESDCESWESCIEDKLNCHHDTTWPMCGPGWAEECDGLCDIPTS
jgi:hypothetical protein